MLNNARPEPGSTSNLALRTSLVTSHSALSTLWTPLAILRLLITTFMSMHCESAIDHGYAQARSAPSLLLQGGRIGLACTRTTLGGDGPTRGARGASS